MYLPQRLKYWGSTKPITIWYDPDHFLYPEIFFTYAVESFKASAKFLVGYELFVGAAHPHDYAAVPLYIAAFLTVIVCAVSDNVLGKYITILLGLGCLFMACFMHSLYYVSDLVGNDPRTLTKLSLLLLLCYIATSGVRNVMLIEQIDEVKHLRSTIFVLIFFRLIIRFLTSLDVQFRVLADILKWNAIVGIWFTMVYFLMWMFVGQDRLPEEHEKNILWKCVLCVYNAFLVKGKKDFAYTDEDKKKQLAEAKSGASVGTVKSSKSMRYAAHDSCLYRAYPKSTEETIQQTIDLIYVLPWVLPGILMGNIFIYVMATTAYQVALLHYPPPLNYSFVKLYSLLFEVPLYLSAYAFGYIRPFSTDLVPTMIGYMFVLLAAIAMMKVQAKIDALSNIYLPRAKTAQIRLYNNLPYDVVVVADWIDAAPYKLESYSMVQRVLTVDSPLSQKSFRIENSSWPKHLINVYEKKASSVCLTSYGPYNKKVPDRHNDPDYEADVMWFKTYNVTEGKAHNDFINITLVVQNLKTKKTVLEIPDAHYVNFFKVKPGQHSVGFYLRLPNTRKMKLNFHYLENNATFHKSSLGMIITEFSTSGMPSLNATKYYFIERTLKFRFILLAQILLASVGNSLASASYYKFLFYESPSKLRSTLFGIVIGSNLFSAGYCVQFREHLITNMWEQVVTHSILYIIMFVIFLRRLTWEY